ncbi:MAG TPA: hypothetical protein VNR38_05090 [Ureibacillus sp.]|nr:hypothetical protein [Ureibacillus sp.]
MKDYRTLKLLDLFEKLFTFLKVDYKIMRRILQVKLTMDGRRVPTIFSQNTNKKNKEHSNQYIKSLWIYVLFGLFTIPFIVMGDHYLFQMSLFYGVITFFIMTSMISDFSSVLLDVRDRNILYPKPVDRRTINTAKLIHIVIYLSFLTIALVGIPLIVGLFTKGVIFFIVTIVNVILLNLLIVALTALIYLFVLRFFDGEKLKDIINYVQIGLSLAILVGYQLLVRSFQFLDLTIQFEPAWWHVFVFPIWFGANTDTLMNGNYHSLNLLLTGLSVVVPLLSIWIYMKFNPTFENHLQKLTFQGKAKEKRRSHFGQSLLSVLCRTQEERTFYRFASLMMKNERDFKLKVYPTLGFSVVIPFLFILNDFREGISGLKESNSYLAIYFSLIMIPTIIVLLKYSGKYKGAWIYTIVPFSQLKPVFSGTFKAFLMKLYLPVYLLLSLIFIILFGIRILPDLVVVFLVACNYSVICFMILKKHIPFSQSFDEYNQNNNGVLLLGLASIVAVFAGLHYLSTFYIYGIYIYLIVAVFALAILWKVAFNVKWEQIYN